MTLVFATIAAMIFATAGWLGTILSATLYGSLDRQADGPRQIAIPAWVLVVASAGVGFCLELLGAQPLRAFIAVIAVLALATCVATDARTGLIPDLFTLGPLVVVLGVSVIERTGGSSLGALAAFVPFAAMALASRGRGMGWGDVKLVTLGGAAVGVAGITAAVTLASVSAFVFGVARGRAREPLAFAPYLAASIAIALVLGNTL